MAIPEEKSTARTAGPKRSAPFVLPLWPLPRDGWIAVAGVALIYAAHWFYGALISDTAMAMNIAAALLVVGILLTPRLRDDVLRLKGLTLPAACFALVIVVALWTLTPWTPGGVHPIWAYVGALPGASTIDKSSTLVEIVKLLGLTCLFVVGLATGARDERARYAIQLVIAAGVVFGVWAFIASVSGAIYQTQGRRLEGHFLNPNTAGTVFALLLVLAAGELLRQLRSARREEKLARALPWATTCLIFAACLVDTASRGATMALLGAAAIYVLLELNSGRAKLTAAMAGGLSAIAALVGVLALIGEQLVDRIFQSHEASVVRLSIWQVHWHAFLASPLFGYGLGAAETVNKTQLDASNYRFLWFIRAILNVYLQWIEEAGIVGAAPMFLCIGLILISTFRGQRRRSRMIGLLISLLAADALVLIHGATDFGLEVPSVAGFWAWLLGLQFSLAQGSSRR